MDPRQATPLRRTDQVRKSVVFATPRNSVASPLRRVLTPGTPVIALENTDDQNERLNRRSVVAMQKRVSNIAPSTGSPLVELVKVVSERELNQHMQTCTKLFTENRISTKNAWELHIIDLLRQITKTQSGNILQVASTSLDISAKVYSIRVDDVHSTGLKLASSVAKVDEERGNAEDGRYDDDDDGEGDKENVHPKKKKKKRPLVGGKKATVDRDGKTLFAPLTKLESVAFSTREDVEASATDNLFTCKLPMHFNGHRFRVLNNDKYWVTEPDKTIENKSADKEYDIPAINNYTLCPPFKDFIVDEWDPDEEEKQYSLEKTNNLTQANGIQNDLVLDEQGLPIADLDGSIHDIFQDNDAIMDDPVSDTEEVHHQDEFQARIHGEIAHISDAVPEEELMPTEYGFNALLRTSTGKMIDKIWAGPSHWKVKFVRSSTARYSGTTVIQQQQQQATKGRKRSTKEPERFSFADDTFTDADLRKLLETKVVMKRARPNISYEKITLPISTFTLCNHFKTSDSLMTKSGVVSIKKFKQIPEKHKECDVQVYNYENPNDSQYCSQHTSEDHHGGDDDDRDAFSQEEYEDGQAMAAEHQHPLNENLTDAPELVPKSYIPYALHAKKMDMKKLKAAVWKHLTNGKSDEQTQAQEAVVTPTSFSKMYAALPNMLNKDMKKELSCPLAFVALLHLCNENTLILKQHPSLKDFDIMKATV